MIAEIPSMRMISSLDDGARTVHQSLPDNEITQINALNEKVAEFRNEIFPFVCASIVLVADVVFLGAMLVSAVAITSPWVPIACVIMGLGLVISIAFRVKERDEINTAIAWMNRSGPVVPLRYETVIVDDEISEREFETMAAFLPESVRREGVFNDRAIFEMEYTIRSAPATLLWARSVSLDPAEDVIDNPAEEARAQRYHQWRSFLAYMVDRNHTNPGLFSIELCRMVGRMTTDQVQQDLSLDRAEDEFDRYEIERDEFGAPTCLIKTDRVNGAIFRCATADLLRQHFALPPAALLGAAVGRERSA